MNCLCCGKPIKSMDSAENASGWHTSCIKNFFGISVLPHMDLFPETLKQIVSETVGKGYTVPGVQKKMSLHLDTSESPRLTLVSYPSGYILKPQTESYPFLPESEFLVMHMAQVTGIKTVPFALLKLQPDGETAYISRRIDRILPFQNREKAIAKLAMEDFCQLDGRITADKYRGSYERCAKIIHRYSTRPGLDLSEFFLRLVFSYVTGNSDMHLKNFSLIETTPGNRNFVLSAAYDLLPVNIIIPEDDEETALTLNGKKRNLRRNDFLTFADNIGLSRKAAENLIAIICDQKTIYEKLCNDSLLPSERKEKLSALIFQRISALESV